MARMQRFAGYYTSAALLVLNTCVALIALNFVLYILFTIRDKGRDSAYVSPQKYGDTSLLHVYPDLDLPAIHRLLNETWSRRPVFDAYTHFKEAPFKGKFVNVSTAGFRFSKNQGAWPPPADSYNIFVFGGSTTFSYGLPDNETVASYLQESLAIRIPRHVNVYNFGIGGYQSTQERILFQELLVRGIGPDMAIFVDGLNDFQYRDGPIYVEGLQRVFQLSNSASWIDDLSLSSAHWPMTRLARGVRGWLNNVPRRGDTEQKDSIDSVAHRYICNRKQIQAIAGAFGVQSVFVWQPISYYKYDRRYHIVHSKDASRNFYAEAGYERMRQIVGSADEGPTFLWCADIQEGLTEPLYVDDVHYTAAMSHRLAEHIAGLLAERHLLPAVAVTRGKGTPR